MDITQLTRFESDNAEEMARSATQAKALFEKHGAQWLRLSRFHLGPFAGQWLAASRYADWEAYGRAQDGLAKDPEFGKLMARMATFSKLISRGVTVGVEL